MENFFMAEWHDWKPCPVSKRVAFANKVLKALGFWSQLAPPHETGLMTTIEQRMNLYHFVSSVLAYGVSGDLVELGCNSGQSSTLIQKIVQHYDPSRVFHVFDSFQGLPERAAPDGTAFDKGMMRTTKEALCANFRRYNLPLPVIHEGWFDDTLPTGLPEKICFAYLDGDFYDSILVSIQHVYPRLSKGAVCVIDDYADPEVYPQGWNKLPGVKKACDEYLRDKPEKISYIYSGAFSHGFFRKV